MWNIDRINTFVGLVSGVIGIVGAVISFLIFLTQRRELRRNETKIGLILVRESDGEEHTLGYKPRRDQATRDEIFGILGMYAGGIRLDTSRLVKIFENSDFSDMMDDKTSTLRLALTDKDYDLLIKRDENLGKEHATPLIRAQHS